MAPTNLNVTETAFQLGGKVNYIVLATERSTYYFTAVSIHKGNNMHLMVINQCISFMTHI